MDLDSVLWAKSEPYKPLMVHLLETGAIAQVLLKSSVFRPVCFELVQRTSLSEDEVISLAGYLASVHDIGKIHPSFVGSGAILSVQKRLEDLHLLYHLDKFRHEQYGAYRLRKIWKECGFFKTGKLFNGFSSVIRYHHQGKLGFLGRMSPENESVWKDLQEDYLDVLYSCFEPPCDFELSHMDSVCMLLLGIIIVSDWIASGDDFAATPVDLSNREIIGNASRLALEFLIRNRLVHQNPFDSVIRFTDLWDFIPRPNMRPLQVEAERLFHDSEEMPLAVIIEAPMGEGKTEAAMYIASQLAKRWHKEGFYVALPTAATSNQMYSRINKMLCYLHLDKAKLMHAMAWLVDRSSDTNFVGDSSFDAKLWTAPMRRGLIAPFSVGTIDQVMMSVMHVKYGVLRLVGLCQKVLVIDEMHSYDAYMSAIIVTLLKWCAVLHIPVVMLSATLPVAKKKEFGRCYVQDVSVIKGGFYPSMTLFYEDKPAKQVLISGSHQSLDVELLNEPRLDDLDFLASHLKEKMESEGGCYCILRNTVKSAQETFLFLKNTMPDVPVFLFHARFSAKLRQDLEHKCVSFFGKDSQCRPEKIILVATQVVEQSLDLDFDYLVTDICPVDLLLQRLGRLWRHQNTVRQNVVMPVAMVLTSPDGNYGSTGMVYAPVILDRTQTVLQNRKRVSLPGDIPELVEMVYDEQKLDNVNLEKWVEHKTAEIIEQNAAATQVLKDPNAKIFCLYDAEGTIDDVFCSDEEDKFLSARTRLGEPSVKLALLPAELFDKVSQGVSVSVAEEVLLCSVSVPERMVRFLFSCKDEPNVLVGTGLLNGMYLLKADTDHSCVVLGQFQIIMDFELGLVIKELK